MKNKTTLSRMQTCEFLRAHGFPCNWTTLHSVMRKSGVKFFAKPWGDTVAFMYDRESVEQYVAKLQAAKVQEIAEQREADEAAAAAEAVAADHEAALAASAVAPHVDSASLIALEQLVLSAMRRLEAAVATIADMSSKIDALHAAWIDTPSMSSLDAALATQDDAIN